METATFGGGCFWGVELRFSQVSGVTGTAAGFEGGTVENPSYREVCTGRTGHAEVVEVKFDPAKVSYAHLLDLFFALHDPTQVDRQGPDWGTQYRSVIFYHSPEQEAAARAAIARLTAEKKFAQPIATRVERSTGFWPAEDYHQKYLEKRGMNSCHV